MKPLELSPGSCAFILAQTALLNCRLAGMQAENQQRAQLGHSMAYGDEHFAQVEREFEAMIGFNEILEMGRS